MIAESTTTTTIIPAAPGWDLVIVTSALFAAVT
jgi:hypothetical protein